MIEDIRHVYCDGDNCIESIDGYNPHSTATEKFIEEDLPKKGWVIVQAEDVIDGFFCGMPIIVERGLTQHFCPKCVDVLRAAQRKAEGGE